MSRFHDHDGRGKPRGLPPIVTLVYRDGSSKIETFAPEEGWVWPHGSDCPDDIVEYQGT